MQTTTTSKQFSLSKSDFLRGLLMAVLGGIVGLIQGMIETGEFDLKKIWHAALIAALAYLTKNFLDKPKVVVSDVPKETMEDVKKGDATVKIS